MSSPSLPLPQWPESLLSIRNSHTVIKNVLSNALDLMMLQEMKAANGLLEALDRHGAFQFEQNYGIMRAMHFAWEAHDEWPEMIRNPNPRKPDYIYKRVSGSGGTSSAFVDELEKAVKKDWTPKSTADKFPDVSKDDFEEAIATMEEDLATNAGSQASGGSLVCTVEVGLAMSGDKRVGALIEEFVVPEYKRLSSGDHKHELRTTLWGVVPRQHVAQSRAYWKSDVSRIISHELEFDNSAIEKYVKEGISIINQRLTKGPVNPLVGKSISEYVKIMDENYIAARHASPDAGGHMSINGFDVKNIPPTFLRDGASEEEILEFEKELDVTLPDDYKEFLRLTNGFYPDEDPSDQTAIFFGISGICHDDTIVDCQVGVNLLPYEYTSLKLMDAFDWPEIDQAFSIGAVGDEGSAWMIPRSYIEKGIAEFDRVYETAEEADKKVYEKAAMDLYGGIEKMRELQWLIITWAHWNPDPEPYAGFTKYLEHEAQYAMERRKDDEAEAEKVGGLKRKRGDESDGDEPNVENQDGLSVEDGADEGDGAKEDQE